ncbi:30S ribosomal protein S12 methylthiotransferase RimO [candidate division WOR-3 bacterium]|nr:30S ribosomal protein S12 methylthiotransferase RimO [candidate division WOR-3 bacterium]
MSRAAVVLLGCPKNQVDAERLLGSLGVAGWVLTDDEASADLIVVTTCAFLGSAVRESEAAIRRALAGKRRRPGTRVAVAGCLVQREGRKLAARFPNVDLFCGIDRLADIPRLLFSKVRYATSPARGLERAASPRLLSTPGHYAYLRLGDGCDNRCSYCLIPRIRGRLRSRPPADIAREAESLARAGVRELVLIAQDTTAWGSDRCARPALPRLLKRLERIPGIEWLRLMYTHPAHVTEPLCRELERNPRVCRYLDLPVQHCSDRILGAMRRRHDRAHLDATIARLRRIPGLALRTTVITGFPGETEAEFEELLAFLAVVRFERLGAYAFSPEPGTRAARLPGQVPEELRAERRRRVLELQRTISRARLRGLRGRELTVLLDTPTEGRTEWDAPEIDGVVRFRAPAGQPGEFIRCRVTGSSVHDLAAEPAG